MARFRIGSGRNEGRRVREGGIAIYAGNHSSRREENAEAARLMGLRGLAYVREKFEWSKLVGDWLNQLRVAASAESTPAVRLETAQGRIPKAY